MKKLLLLAALAAAGMSASAQDLYIIGSNVNGNSWALAAPDAKMENLGSGVYTWTGEILGTGFKINDGTWDNQNIEGTEVVANIGSNGDPLEVGEGYYYEASTDSKDIAMTVDAVSNPTVVINLVEGWVMVSGKVETVDYDYYLPGDFSAIGWNLVDECKFTKEGDKYVLKGITFENAGQFKFASDGWTKAYGCPKAEVEEGSEEEAGPSITIAADNLTGVLTLGADNVASTLVGTFDVEATIAEDGETATLIFSVAGAVSGIDAENAPVYYYNLQGVRVENPTNGIYVKVVGEKAAKVLFNK